MRTQVTGPSELDTAAEPSGPQGMPIAGRVSSPVGFVVVGLVVVFGAALFGTVVSALGVVVG
ncbi:hypothetical protein, partial [Mycobacterium sp.]|uniref:hypothetical protein n=1 Tax=Mycobacterium sp. TaxID=1785 RepID=UPI0031E0F3D5